MANDYRRQLLDAYHRRSDTLDASEQSKLQWFELYAADNYLPAIRESALAAPSIVDVGCSRGYLLAALAKAGYTNLHGIDWSAEDLAIAQRIVPGATLAAGDGRAYLEAHKGEFDVILAKAILEHLPKQDTIPFLEAAAGALTSDGVLVVDVPNMDWLFATHERYMDFTHEVGFTAESLRQVLDGVFTSAEVRPVDSLYLPQLATPAALAFRVTNKVARLLIRSLLYAADPEGASNPIWARSLIGLGRARDRR